MGLVWFILMLRTTRYTRWDIGDQSVGNVRVKAPHNFKIRNQNRGNLLDITMFDWSVFL